MNCETLGLQNIHCWPEKMKRALLWGLEVGGALPSVPISCSLCSVPKHQTHTSRTYFGTELTSFVGVASFPKTNSIIRSSGVALTGSSGGISVMISATCSVQRGMTKGSPAA